MTETAVHFPSDTYYQIVHTLRTVMPPPVADTPDDHARRDRAIIAHVASLLPVGAEEAHLAARYVAADAHAMDCIRLARRYEESDTARATKCTSQSASMMREARSLRAQLHRAQAAREQRDEDPTTSETAAQIQQNVLSVMVNVPPNPSPVPAREAAPPPPVPQPATSETTRCDPVAEAERYALHHRKRAALIRRLRRMPEKTDIGWVAPEIVQALITGTTPILQELDQKPRRDALHA
jgi:hypothetical protein